MLLQKIAILATGNEIVNGDIANSNGQNIARLLFEHCIGVGSHMTVVDDQVLIEQAMRFLLQDHAALITIGGLGPTSDDKTRFALSTVVDQPLIFHPASWDALHARLSRLGYTVAESNRQQALFPSQATVIPNTNGTANACKVVWQNKLIYMLPGPPRECLPIFQQIVLPELLAADFAQPLVRRSWLLQGIGESNLASSLDCIIDHQRCVLGYRASYPYLELKLEASSQTILQAETAKLMPFIQAYIISEERLPASSQLFNHILVSDKRYYIFDKATGGLLQTKLHSPQTVQRVFFNQNPGGLTQQDVQIELSGLEQFWQGVEDSVTSLTIRVTNGFQDFQQQFSLRYAMRDIRPYAIELACWEILKQLKSSTP
jgi:nicotinamide-nucleotide amidase